MSEFKGTKGKWEIEYLAEEECSRAVINNGLIDVWSIRTTFEEANANALLISKAPEMLEMLEKAERTLREVYECDTTEMQQLIKEATEL